MADEKAGSGPLRFKGEKKAKKHKKRKHADLSGIEDDGPTIAGETSAGVDEGWLNPPGQGLILGPLYLVCITPSQSAYSSASSQNPPNPCAIAIFPTPISPIAKVGPAGLSEEALGSLNPDDVNHVFVCARVLDSHEKVTLRAANGRYLAASAVGEVSAEQEARGMQEEWIFEAVNGEDPTAEPDRPSGLGDQVEKGKDVARPTTSDGIYALRSAAYGKYVSVEEVAGGKLELRCDSEQSEDGACHFLVRMQTEQLGVARAKRAEERAKRGLGARHQDNGITILKPGQTLGDLEAASIRKAQARGAGRLFMSEESPQNLKKARKEGRLAEEMLDRRSKLKSDKFAK